MSSHLAQPSSSTLPPELIGAIARLLAEGEYRKYKNTVTSCMLVGKVFAEEFRPFLFEELYIRNVDTIPTYAAMANPESTRISNEVRRARQLKRLTACLALLDQYPGYSAMVKRVTIFPAYAARSPIVHRLLDSLTSVASMHIGEECTHLVSTSPFYSSIARLGTLPTLHSVKTGTLKRSLRSERNLPPNRYNGTNTSIHATFHEPCQGCLIPLPMLTLYGRASHISATLGCGNNQSVQKAIDVSGSNLHVLDLAFADFEPTTEGKLNLQAAQSLRHLSLYFFRVKETAPFVYRILLAFIVNLVASLPKTNPCLTSISLTFEGLTSAEFSFFLEDDRIPVEDLKFEALGKLLGDRNRFSKLEKAQVNVITSTRLWGTMSDQANREILPFVRDGVRSVSISEQVPLRQTCW